MEIYDYFCDGGSDPLGYASGRSSKGKALLITITVCNLDFSPNTLKALVISIGSAFSVPWVQVQIKLI